MFCSSSHSERKCSVLVHTVKGNVLFYFTKLLNVPLATEATGPPETDPLFNVIASRLLVPCAAVKTGGPFCRHAVESVDEEK